MTKVRKLNVFTVSAIVIGMLSFALVFNSLTPSYSAKKEIVEEFSYELRDVSDVIFSNETVVEKSPTIDNNTINFRVNLKGKDDYFQFFFDILNASVRTGTVKDIKIIGLKNDDKVRISIIGIKKGDIIEGSRYIDNVKVAVECLEDNYDNNGNLQPLIEDISIIIEID